MCIFQKGLVHGFGQKFGIYSVSVLWPYKNIDLKKSLKLNFFKTLKFLYFLKQNKPNQSVSWPGRYKSRLSRFEKHRFKTVENNICT